MNSLLFIPTFNCEKQISRLIHSLESIQVGEKFDIVFIDNQSSDSSVEVVRGLLEKSSKLGYARLYQNKCNLGLGGSHKVAIELSILEGYEYLVVLHGDDQANPKDIEVGINLIKLNTLDCVLGARFMKGSHLEGYSKIRVLGNKFFNLLFTVRFFVPVSDMGSGLNVYSTNFLRKIRNENHPDDLTFNNSLLMWSLLMKSKIAFFPISWSEKDQISNVRIVRQSLAILRILSKSRAAFDSIKNDDGSYVNRTRLIFSTKANS
jgi:dolichol-phosphate mannosyltransferase